MIKRITGVGFLLFAKNGGGDTPKLFTVKELGSKPEYHKSAGMQSFPLETYKKDDGSFRKTIMRLLVEEAGMWLDEVEICGIDNTAFQLIPGRDDIDTVYGYGIYTGDPDRSFVPADSDIEFAGWKSTKELLSEYFRIEVPPLLKHFGKNHLKEILQKL